MHNRFHVALDTRQVYWGPEAKLVASAAPFPATSCSGIELELELIPSPSDLLKPEFQYEFESWVNDFYVPSKRQGMSLSSHGETKTEVIEMPLEDLPRGTMKGGDFTRTMAVIVDWEHKVQKYSGLSNLLIVHGFCVG